MSNNIDIQQNQPLLGNNFKDQITYEAYERHRKVIFYDNVGLYGKFLYKLEEIDKSKGIFNILKFFVSIGIIVSIFVTTHQAISDIQSKIDGLQNTINFMINENSLLQENLLTATTNINQLKQDIELQLNNINYLNSTINNLSQELNNINVTYLQQEIGIANSEFQHINDSMNSFNNLLNNETVYITKLYNTTIENINYQANKTINSLVNLNTTLWQITDQLNVTINDVQNNITEFKTKLPYSIFTIPSTNQFTATSCSQPITILSKNISTNSSSNLNVIAQGHGTSTNINGHLKVDIYINNQPCNAYGYGYSEITNWNTVVAICGTTIDEGTNLVELKIDVESSCPFNPPAIVYYDEPIMIIQVFPH